MSSTRPPSRKGLSKPELEVLTSIEEHGMLRPGQRVAVACSGGADSTFLLEVLTRLAPRHGWVISVAHFNHQLRGAESDQDAEFVREMAAAHSLEFHESADDVRAAARRTHSNLEAAARRLRYEFLRSLVERGAVDAVAVGHTADDQAETILLRLLRGAGPQGLAAIRPQLPGGIIRPLITVRGTMLRNWLRERGIAWREDATNQDSRLRRNLVRHEIIPALTKINPGVIGTLAQTAALAQSDEAFWSHYVAHLAAKHCRRDAQTIRINVSALSRLPCAAAYRLLKWALETLLTEEAGQDSRKKGKPASAAPHYRQIRSLHEWAIRTPPGAPPGAGGRQWRKPALALPRGVEARASSQHLILSAGRVRKPRLASSQPSGYRILINPPCQLCLPQAGLRCGFELIAPAGEAADYNGEGRFLLDQAHLIFPLVLRNWRPGDAYRPQGRHKSRKLKELFQRHRVPSKLRASWPVLESGGRIVWSRQFGPAHGLHGQDSTVLQVTVVEDMASK